MGYRTYIAKINKEEYNKIKDLSKEELYQLKEVDPEDDYLGVYDLADDIYGLGKYVEEFDSSLLKPFFTNKELNEYYNTENELYIVGKAFFMSVIKRYEESVKNIYLDLLRPFSSNIEKDLNNLDSEFIKSIDTNYSNGNFNHSFDFSKITQQEQTALFKIIEHIRSMGHEWNNKIVTPYDLDEENDRIVSSWKYEYSLFELVRLYKTFDWENDLLVCYAY